MSTSPAPQSKSQWREYKNPEGRIYWSHSVTKQSVWEKPDELRTSFEKAMAKTQWKQYFSSGRPYYVNSSTKETKWDLPPELVKLKKRIDNQEAYEIAKQRAKEAGQRTPTPPPRSRSSTPDHLRAGDHNALQGYQPPSPIRERKAPPTGPKKFEKLETIIMPPGGFQTLQEAEAAFMHLLKKEGVDETWTWDHAMRRIIMDPLYRALDTLAQKRAAFEKFIMNIHEERRKAKEDRIARLRPLFQSMFEQHPAIKTYSTMKTAAEVFAHDKNWRELDPDEREMLLEEWTTAKKHQEAQHEKELRERNIQKLGQLIRQLDVTVSTRWRGAYDMILSSPQWKSDPELQQIATVDMLDVYDDYLRILDNEFDDETRRLRSERIRTSRKAREGFRALLAELQASGELTRLSKWKDTYSKIKDDERYMKVLGLPGSSPMDMWMDCVDDMAEETERAVEKVERTVGMGKVKLESTFEDFENMLKGTTLENVLDSKVRADAYEMMHGKFVQVAQAESRRAERKRRHRIDDLRYAIKKVGKHIDVDMTYEEALAHIKDLPEFKDIPDEEDRKTAYDKFIRRQKEKLAEVETSDLNSAHSPDKVKKKEDRRDSFSLHMDVDSSRRESREYRYKGREERSSKKEQDDKDYKRDYGREEYDRDYKNGKDEYKKESGREDYKKESGREDYKKESGREDYKKESGREDYKKEGGREEYDRDLKRESGRDKEKKYGSDGGKKDREYGREGDKRDSGISERKEKYAKYERRDKYDKVNKYDGEDKYDKGRESGEERESRKEKEKERKHATDFYDDREIKRVKRDDDVEEGEI